MSGVHRTDCRHFGGYRPCRHHRSCAGCPHHSAPAPDILVVNLDALGDVLRNTALLPGLRQAHPAARVTWLTRPLAVPLVQGHPLVDRVLPLGPEAVWELEARTFDLLLVADKSPVAGGLAARIPAREKRGFGLDPGGAIVPLNPEAGHLYAMGLDDALKYRRNRRSAPDLLCEALGVPYVRTPYRLHGVTPAGPPRRVGVNTGSSPQWPLKRMDPDVVVGFVRACAAHVGEPVLLLGGPEDGARNRELAAHLGPLVELTPTDQGLEAGAAHVARCEAVVTGDSLGLHLAVALGCHVVAWFGPTCPQEIDLYDRGVRLLADVDCAPCWRSACPRSPPCGATLDPGALLEAVVACLEARRAGRPLDDVRGGCWGPWAPPAPPPRPE